ncbi:MAG: hypothetical protein WBV69_17035 [Candidatus Sulfotelmatobacter sp.]
MKEGCREIVRTVIGKKSADVEGEFNYIDWTKESEAKAKSMFLELIENLNAKDAASAVAEEWDHWDLDGVKSTLMLRMLTHEMIEDASWEGSPTGFSIRAAVKEATVTYDLDPSEFKEICQKSTSSWDRYVQNLLAFDELTTALSNCLYPAVQVYRMRNF